jgi:Protein of unknown function (DUF3194)
MLSSRRSDEKYILTKIPSENLEELNVTVETQGSKPVNLSVEVDLRLTTDAKKTEAKDLADEAAKHALNAAENYLRNLK